MAAPDSTIRSLADAALAAALAVVPELAAEDLSVIVRSKRGVIVRTIVPWERIVRSVPAPGSPPTPGTTSP
jgi:hypothetical protein